MEQQLPRTRPSPAKSTRQQRKELQRRIFLNTMRNVYPDSLRISYTHSEQENKYLLQPLSVQDKCRSISDKVWSVQMTNLNSIFARHVNRRERSILTVWSMIVFAASLWLAFGLTTRLLLDQLWYAVTGPLLILLATALAPTLIFTHVAMKPLLVEFEQWKHDVNMQLDKCGIEVVKITSGELVSAGNGSGYGWRILGAVYYGSSVWFRYEDAQVEIFWRSVKSGRHVRRYSLMISTPTNPNGGVQESAREQAKLDAVGDNDDEDDEDVGGSAETLKD